ncbi:hypothetical protein VIGAN_07164900, partial [Vigna angularis var. angularis]
RVACLEDNDARLALKPIKSTKFTTGKSVITDGNLLTTFRPSVKCWSHNIPKACRPSVMSAIRNLVFFPRIPQFQNSLVSHSHDSSMSEIPLSPSMVCSSLP